MPGRVPDALVVITDATDGAAFDFWLSQILASGSFSGSAPLGRGEPGFGIGVTPTAKVIVGGPMDMNGFVNRGICFSCDSALSLGNSSSMVECVGRVCPRIGPDTVAGV